MSGRDRGAPLWPGLADKNPADVVDGDLARAKIEVSTDLGKVDFHALRHTFGTMLARAGVKPQECVRLMRHKDINLTLKYYPHLSNEDLSRAIDRGFEASLTPSRVGRTRSTGAAEIAHPHAASCVAMTRNHSQRAQRADPTTGSTYAPARTVRHRKTQWAEWDSNPRLDDYESTALDR